MQYKILMVEDDPVIREQLQLLLAGSGYQVETAGDAAAALVRMQTFGPHLVVLDIGLPGASGFELCSQIRAFSQAPIVFVTSSSTDQDELTSILLGAMPSSPSLIARPSCWPKLLPCCAGLIPVRGRRPFAGRARCSTLKAADWTSRAGRWS